MDIQLSLTRRIVGLALLVGAMICEGLDITAASFAAADVMQDFGVAKQDLGPFLAASAFGMFIGSAFLGAWGDRYGRRPMVIAGTVGYAVITLLAALSVELWQLVLARFVVGVCVGAMLPSAIVLAGELFKNLGRARMSAAVTLGISLGATLTSVATVAILPDYGWQGLFVFCGAAPLLFSALLLAWLPESPEFNKADVAGHAHPRISPAPLFSKGLRGMTSAIWLLIILLSATLYLLGSWVPLLLAQSGLDAHQAAMGGGAYHLGGLFGAVLAVLLLGRSSWFTLAGFLVCSAAAVLWVSQVDRPVALLMVTLTAAGLFVTGSQAAFNGLAASAYPVALRASGFGYALGVSRVGSIGGPIAGAALIGAGLQSAQDMFLAPIAPLLIAASAATWLALRARRLRAAGAPAEE